MIQMSLLKKKNISIDIENKIKYGHQSKGG